MAWVERLRGAVVGLDTAPLIYFIEENPSYIDLVEPFFVAVARGEIRVVTSVVTMIEVLVNPFRRGDRELAKQYRDILQDSAGVRMAVRNDCRRGSQAASELWRSRA